MTQLPGNDHQRNAVSNHQGSICMAQTMHGDFRYAGPGNEATEPLRHAVGKYWGSGIGGEYPVILIPPGVPQFRPLR